MNNGLSNKEVIESRKTYGTNIITSNKTKSFIKQFIMTLGDPIIKILLIALVVKTVFLFQNFDWFETLGIMIAIFLASFISTISEYGSEKAFIRLQEESSKIMCKVKRNGKLVLVSIDEIVVGDIVKLETGDTFGYLTLNGGALKRTATIIEILNLVFYSFNVNNCTNVCITENMV